MFRVIFYKLIMQSQLHRVCSQQKYSDSFRNYFPLNFSESLMIQILVPLSAVCCIANIIFFFKFPNAREPPFDILLLITVFSIINIIVYTSTLIYNSINPIQIGVLPPDNFSNFCQITGTMHFGSQFGISIYNTIFCFYYTCKIRNPLRTWVQDSKEIHALCFILALIGIIVVFLTGQIGVSVLGVCGLKVAKSSIFIYFTLFIVYLFVLIVTSIIFLKYLRRISTLDGKARVFFKYFLVYTLLISAIYLIYSITLILLIVDCYTGLTENLQQQISTITNSLILATPIVTTIIICFHPDFGRKVLYNFFIRFKNKKESIPNRSTLMIELTQMNSSQPRGYLSSIKQRNRVSLLSTILGCISLGSSQRKYNSKLPNRSTMGSSEQEHIYGWNFNDINQIQLDQQIIMENKEYFVDKVPAVSIKFTSHASSVFDFLMAQDNVDFLQKSTNPYKNLQKVYKNAQADGGSSGQFFFFTYDSRILLKTITKNELNVLLERLENYYHYLKNHTQSFIVKIYGVFTVVQRDTQEQMYFMMMGNLLEDIDRKYMLRIYDCKGSSHKRQVFKQKAEQQPQYHKKTMKDVDFGRLQNKVWINKDMSKKIQQILKQDSLFFYQNGLIDYSLIIIKIDYYAYCLDLEGQKPKLNQRNMFVNDKQPNMIYILGIIDYLETWNVRKKSERWYKSLFNRSQTISSQSPAFYSQRFIQNLVQKIFS